MNEWILDGNNVKASSTFKVIRRRLYMLFKRVFDIAVSLFFVILLSPIFVILTILIRRDGGKAFFVQPRSGKNGQVFNLYKFRSMVPNNDVNDKKTEDKITKIGRFIRKTSLDELPQIFNVLKGEMSFIGPRPWIVEYAKYFTEEQKRRLNVLPGITGLAQASGRNDLTILDRINYDLTYVNNISLYMDLKVIYKTVKSVFSKSEAYSNNKAAIHSEIDILKAQHKKK